MKDETLNQPNGNDTMKQSALKQIWDDYRRSYPHIRIRDAAKKLYVSEAQLLATGCGDQVIRLEPNWQQLLDGIASLGIVMALTRNDFAVHEVTDRYQATFKAQHEVEVLGEQLSLKLNLACWQHAFAVEEVSQHGARHSLQFFDRFGDAVHKVYMTPKSCLLTYRALVTELQAANQSQEQHVHAKLPLPEQVNNHDTLVTTWQQTNAQAEFYAFNTGLVRIDVLKQLSPKFSIQLRPHIWRDLLYKLVELQLPISLGVANQGALQTYTGSLHKIAITGPWFNILDESFNLHLQDQAIKEAWLVRQVTHAGQVTSLQAYDAQGENIMLLYALDADTQMDQAPWSDLVAALPPLGMSELTQ